MLRDQNPLVYNQRMAEQFPYPFPCKDDPDLDTKHEAAALIHQYQTAGYIKRCAHLTIRSPHQFDPFGERSHSPKCREDSFVTVEGELGERLFCGCPKQCKLYKAAWRSKTEEWLRTRWLGLWDSVAGVGQWYASLSMPIQIIFAPVLLAIVGSRWRDTVIEALRIIFTK